MPTRLIRPYNSHFCQLIEILHCPQIHRVLFTILYKYEKKHIIGHNKGLLFYCIWILEQSLCSFNLAPCQFSPAENGEGEDDEMIGMDESTTQSTEWFKTKNLVKNSKQVIQIIDNTEINESIISLLCKIYLKSNDIPKHSYSLNELALLEFPFDVMNHQPILYDFESSNDIRQFSISYRLFRIIHSFCNLDKDICKQYLAVLCPLDLSSTEAEIKKLGGNPLQSDLESGFVSNSTAATDLPIHPSSSNSSSKEVDRRKAKARKLQAKRMKQMKNRNQAMLKKMEDSESKRREQQESLIEALRESEEPDESSSSQSSNSKSKSKSPKRKFSVPKALPYQTNSQNSIECCICSGKDRWPDKEPRLMGLVCRIDTNATLGRKISTDHEFVDYRDFKKMNDPKISDPEAALGAATAERIYVDTASNLVEFYRGKIPVENCLSTLPFDQFSSPTISSCGHYLHFRCFKHYIGALMGSRKLTSDDVKVAGIDFGCPVCRQPANMILLNYDSVPMVNNLLDEDISSHKDLEEIYSNLKTNKIDCYSHNFRPQDECDTLLLTKELRAYFLEFLSGIHNIHPKVGRNLSKPLRGKLEAFSPDDTGAISFNKIRWLYTHKEQSSKYAGAISDFEIMFNRAVYSAIETEIVSCKDNLLTQNKISRIYRDNPIRLIVQSVAQAWAEIHGSLKVAEVLSESNTNYATETIIKWMDLLYGSVDQISKYDFEQVPALLREPVHFLISLTLSMFPLSDELFLQLIGNIFSLVYVQNLVLALSSMNKEERSSWRMKAASLRISGSSDFSLELVGLIQHLTRRFDRIGLSEYCYGEMISHATRGRTANHSNHSTKISFDTTEQLEEFCRLRSIPFLQASVILYQSLYDKPKMTILENSSKNLEYEMLVKYLNLSTSKRLNLSDCVRWPGRSNDKESNNTASNARNCINLWLEQLNVSVNKEAVTSSMALTSTNTKKNCFPILKNLHLHFRNAKLIKPDIEYVDIYSRLYTYAKKKGPNCHPVVCLLCGDVLIRRLERDEYSREKYDGTLTKHAKVCNCGTIVYWWVFGGPYLQAT